MRKYTLGIRPYARYEHISGRLLLRGRPRLLFLRGAAPALPSPLDEARQDGDQGRGDKGRADGALVFHDSGLLGNARHLAGVEVLRASLNCGYVILGTPRTHVGKAAQRVLHLLLARQRELVARRVERGLDLAAAAQAEHGHDAVDGLPARAARRSCMNARRARSIDPRRWICSTDFAATRARTYQIRPQKAFL